MPTPPRTSLQEIVSAGRSILRADGLDALTMQRVAEEVGVRAPSLYKRVRDRDDLVRLVADDVIRELGERLEAAATTSDPRQDLAALARTARGFAQREPAAYGLAFARLPGGLAVDREGNQRASQPVLRSVTALAGDRHSLEASRMFVAWSHGFISMELAGAFRLSGDVDAAHEFGIRTMVQAVARTKEPA